MPNLVQDIPEIIKGQPIQAAPLEKMRDQVIKTNITVAPPLRMRTGPHGTSISIDLPAEFFATIGAGSGDKYAWTEAIPVDGGGWAAGYRSGTTTTMPAIESSGNTGVPTGTIVEVSRSPTSVDYRFSYAACP